MKKISTLIALATIATVGSVYATWSYSGSTRLTSKFNLDGATVVGITDKVSAEKGGLAMDRSNFSIVIDDANNDYDAEYTASGYLTVTYTPSKFVSDEIKKNGLQLYFNIDSTIGEYEGTKIFSYDTTKVALSSPTANNVDPETQFAESFTYTIQATEIDKMISFYTNTYSDVEANDDGTLRLDTEEKYTNFKTALHTGALMVVISDTNL